MSRSYKKGYSSWHHTSEDKWARKVYNRCRRAKDKHILRECEIFYRDCNTFRPYESCCGLNGEVCDIDVDWYYLELDDPHDAEIYHNCIINPEEILCDVKSKRMNKCIGCGYSENCWENAEFHYAWDVAPDEQFCDNRVDYSVKFSDKWSWPSDGGSYYREDLLTVRKDINEELFAAKSPSRWRDATIWEEYCDYRDARNISKYPHSWRLQYEIPTGIELVKDYWYSYKPYEKGMYIPPEDKKYCYRVDPSPWDKNISYLNRYEKRPVTEKFDITLDHSPRRGSDIPKNAINIRSYRKDKWKHCQAHNDWGLMSFLFYRNIIPTTFKSREEMTSWIMKHNEEIANKWYKIKNRK